MHVHEDTHMHTNVYASCGPGHMPGLGWQGWGDGLGYACIYNIYIYIDMYYMYACYICVCPMLNYKKKYIYIYIYIYINQMHMVSFLSLGPLTLMGLGQQSWPMPTLRCCHWAHTAG